jgi:SAM-dependent methyltransferase
MKKKQNKTREREGKRRSKSPPDILIIHKITIANFRELFGRFFKGRLIDIGCGTKPYKEVLKDYVTEHIGVDHSDTSHDTSNIDIFSSAYSIPLEDNSFDSALCTCVLEHLEEPELALKECHRLLKPGGYAIYHTPFIWHLHEEPRDFYRYTIHGLKYLFDKAGFEIVEIRPICGFVITFLQLHLYLVRGKFNRGLIKWLGLFRFYNFICHKLGLFLNRFDNSTQYTCNYITVARKPAGKENSGK